MQGGAWFLAAAFGACWVLGVVPWVGLRAGAAAAIPGGLLAYGLSCADWALPLLVSLERAADGGFAAVRWAMSREALLAGGGAVLVFGSALLAVAAVRAGAPGLERCDYNLKGKHVVITGGSSGIGLAVAVRAAQLGARHLTLVARRVPELERAAATVRAAAPGCVVAIQSADVTSTEAMESALNASRKEAGGEVHVLVCASGAARTGYFLDCSVADLEQQVSLNYMGHARAVRLALPGMVAAGEGRIVLVSSALAVTAFCGYAAYTPSKWALRGLADSLRNELYGTGVKVSVSYPPDTDTPGYAEEEKSKPREAKWIAPPSLNAPADVAKGILDGVLRGDYHIGGPDSVQNLMVSNMSGATPKPLPLAVEMALSPLLTLVQTLFRMHMDNVVRMTRPYGTRRKGTKVE